MSGDKDVDLQEKIKIICPNCGAFLKGTTREMIGDIGVCRKCKAEFTIEDTSLDAHLHPARMKRKARGQIKGGIVIGIVMIFMSVMAALATDDYSYFVLVGLLILYIFSAYKRWFYINLILYAFIACAILAGFIMKCFSTTDLFLRFVYIFWSAVFCYGLSGPILGMLNEKKAIRA